jgi:hypothetical protein
VSVTAVPAQKNHHASRTHACSAARPAFNTALRYEHGESEKHSKPIDSVPAQFNLILSAPLRSVSYSAHEICRRSATDRTLDVMIRAVDGVAPSC